MTGPLCACGAPSPGAVICTACGDRLRADLRLAVSLSEDLDAAVARLTVRGGGGRRTSDVQPLPFDPSASEAAGQLRTVLAGWTRVMQESHAKRSWPWPPDTVPGMAGWLDARMTALRQHEAAADVVTEVRDAVSGVRRVIGWDLVVRAVRSPGMTELAAAVAASDVLGSPAQISDWLSAVGLSVAESTVSSWGTRGRIERKSGGLYRLSEAYAMAAARVRG